MPFIHTLKLTGPLDSRHGIPAGRTGLDMAGPIVQAGRTRHQAQQHSVKCLKNVPQHFEAEQLSRFSTAGIFWRCLSAWLWTKSRDVRKRKNKANASPGYDSNRRNPVKEEEKRKNRRSPHSFLDEEAFFLLSVFFFL